MSPIFRLVHLSAMTAPGSRDRRSGEAAILRGCRFVPGLRSNSRPDDRANLSISTGGRPADHGRTKNVRARLLCPDRIWPIVRNIDPTPLAHLRLRPYASRMTDFSTGDRVSWATSQGRTQGEIIEKKTSDFNFAGQTFHASKDEPAFIVKSEKTDAEAAHKASALRKLSPH